MGQETTRLDDDLARMPAPVNDQLAGDSPGDIEQNIEQTRSEMSGTIDEIQERLNPDRLKAQAKAAVHDQTIGRVVDAKDQAVEKVQDLAAQATDKVRSLTGQSDESNDQTTSTASQITSTARDTGSTIVDTIRSNPIPVAIAGAGLGWFFTRRTDHDQGRSNAMRNDPTTRTGYTNWDRQQPEPGHLSNDESDTFMSQASSTGGDVVAIVQRNPVPAALAGLSVGWILMRKSRGNGNQSHSHKPEQRMAFGGDYGYRGGQSVGSQGSDSEGGRMSEMAGNVQEKAGNTMQRAEDMGSQAMDRVSHAGSMAQNQMGQLPHQAKDQLRHMTGALSNKMHETPLTMGFVAIGIGLAVGMLLPETQKENQVFGEKRDELMEQAHEKVGQAVDRAQEVAQDAAHAAEKTVQNASQSQSQSSATTA